MVETLSAASIGRAINGRKRRAEKNGTPFEELVTIPAAYTMPRTANSLVVIVIPATAANPTALAITISITSSFRSNYTKRQTTDQCTSNGAAMMTMVATSRVSRPNTGNNHYNCQHHGCGNCRNLFYHLFTPSNSKPQFVLRTHLEI
jgi:hypothetical protein